MVKRIVTTFLWALMGWTIGSVVGLTVGASVVLAPAGGIALGSFVALDPLRLFFSPRAPRLLGLES